MLTPEQYTRHPWCPHLISTLHRVVDEVSLPMSMPGPCSGTTCILVRGPGGPRAGAMGAPAPRVEVYPTQYGDVTQLVIPPTVYETVQALGYHHLGDLYTADRRIKGERTLKERVPARKGIPGLRAWLARYSAVLVLLLRVPSLRWQAAPKDWIPSAVPAYPAKAVIGGRVAKTTLVETVYHRGYAPFSFLPPVTCRDQCQLSPTALSDLWRDQASIPARVGYEAPWGVKCTSGSGLPLDWFDSDQHRHITAHRMDNNPTMTVLAHRSSRLNTVLDTTCLLCGAQPETAPHLWACSA